GRKPLCRKGFSNVAGPRVLCTSRSENADGRSGRNRAWRRGCSPAVQASLVRRITSAPLPPQRSRTAGGTGTTDRPLDCDSKALAGTFNNAGGCGRGAGQEAFVPFCGRCAKEPGRLTG